MSILTIKNYSFGKPGFLDLLKYEPEIIQLIGTNTFEDLKRKLGEVSEMEWATIPDIGDYRVKRQKRAS